MSFLENNLQRSTCETCLYAMYEDLCILDSVLKLIISSLVVNE